MSRPPTARYSTASFVRRWLLILKGHREAFLAGLVGASFAASSRIISPRLRRLLAFGYGVLG